MGWGDAQGTDAPPDIEMRNSARSQSATLVGNEEEQEEGGVDLD